MSETTRESQGRFQIEDVYSAIATVIRRFESTLDERYMVGLLLPAYGPDFVMTLIGVSYAEPSLLVFDGLVDEHYSSVMLQASQLNFQLISLVDEYNEFKGNPPRVIFGCLDKEE